MGFLTKSVFRNAVIIHIEAILYNSQVLTVSPQDHSLIMLPTVQYSVENKGLFYCLLIIYRGFLYYNYIQSYQYSKAAFSRVCQSQGIPLQ